MLSALSSFLPPALQLGGGAQDKALRPNVDEIAAPKQTESPTAIEHKDVGKSPAVDEQGVKKKKERTHESFIVVRPPPSKSNHPLNLQVQLVPPSSRAPLPRTSFSASTPASPSPFTPDPGSASNASEPPLTRTTSNRSDVSAYSNFTSFSTGSTSSFSSVTSTSTNSTAGGGRRMIIPLYNLQAHNVLTNVIVDAGTDAKIAKFHKRGLEVIGLVMLDVVETMRGASFGQGHQLLLSADSQAQQHTPTSSHASLNSDATQESPPLSHQQHQSSPHPPQQAPQQEKGGARRLFGKVFKRKGDTTGGSPNPSSPYPNPSSSNRSPLPSIDRDASLSTTPKASNKRSSLLLAANAHVQSPSLSDQAANSPVPGAQQAQQQTTVLGIQPTIHGGVTSPDGTRARPTRYVWVVKKWLKGPPSGIALPTVGLAPGQGVVDALVEVSFEWVKATSNRAHGRRGKDKERKKRRSSTGVSSNTPSLTSLRHGSGRRSESRGRPSIDAERHGRTRTGSPESVHTTTTATTDDESPRRHRDDDDDSDSDPEDSETPWTCTLVVRKLYGNGAANRLSHLSTTDDGRGASPTPSSGDVKVKVAAVVPAPHHPKVVSLLKIPFPLPDIVISSKPSQSQLNPHHASHLLPLRHHSHDVDFDVEARKRVVTPSGVARPAVATGMGSPPATPTQAAISSGGSASAGLGKLAGRFKSSLSPGLPSGQMSNGSYSSSHSSDSSMSHAGGEGVLLSAEEIKDAVSCTALWLVVREGFGGVGKVNRKGDGWRIRG